MLEVKNKLPREGLNKILIRGTNWIGDAVMTLPAVASVRAAYPGAHQIGRASCRERVFSSV